MWTCCAKIKNEIGKQILASEQNGHESFLHDVYCELDQSRSLQRDRQVTDHGNGKRDDSGDDDDSHGRVSRQL